VAAEACEREGLRIATLEAQTLAKLNAVLPPRWSHGNPVDLVGIKHMGENTTATTCLNLLMEDKNVDSVISFLPPVFAPPGQNGNFGPDQFRMMHMENRKRLDSLGRQVKQYGKPLLVISRFMAQSVNQNSGTPYMPGDRLPEYSSPHRAARVIRHLVKYRQYLEYSKNRGE
jgi:acetyltransferase